MNIAIIGSGRMAKGIATRAIAGNHEVKIYDRDETKAKELAIQLGENAQAASLKEKIDEEIVILALPYMAILEVAKEISGSWGGKIIVDISNPVDFQTFELATPAGSSGAEEIAKLLPKSAKLAKAFNTTFSGTLMAGNIEGKKLDVFVATDSQEAADTLIKLAEDGGMRGIYAGPLKRARALEGMQLIQMSLQEKLGTNWMSGIKILP